MLCSHNSFVARPPPSHAHLWAAAAAALISAAPSEAGAEVSVAVANAVAVAARVWSEACGRALGLGRPDIHSRRAAHRQRLCGADCVLRAERASKRTSAGPVAPAARAGRSGRGAGRRASSLDLYGERKPLISIHSKRRD